MAEPKQLELPEPKKDLIMEWALGVEELRGDLISAIGLVFMRPLQTGGETPDDGERIAKELLLSLIATSKNYSDMEFIDFIVHEVQNRDYKLPEGALDDLENRLAIILKKRSVSILLGARARCETLLANHKKGKEVLAPKALNRVQELKFDLNFQH